MVADFFSAEAWMNLRISHVTDASFTLRHADEGSTSVRHHTLILQFILLVASLSAFLDKTCPTLPLIGYMPLDTSPFELLT